MYLNGNCLSLDYTLNWLQLELRNTSGKLQPKSQVLVHRFLFVYKKKKKKKKKKMIVSLFYAVLNLLGLSFLEKGSKSLLLGSIFPVRCLTSFYKHLMT